MHRRDKVDADLVGVLLYSLHEGIAEEDQELDKQTEHETTELIEYDGTVYEVEAHVGICGSFDKCSNNVVRTTVDIHSIYRLYQSDRIQFETRELVTVAQEVLRFFQQEVSRRACMKMLSAAEESESESESESENASDGENATQDIDEELPIPRSAVSGLREYTVYHKRIHGRWTVEYPNPKEPTFDGEGIVATVMEPISKALAKALVKSGARYVRRHEEL